MTADFPGRRGRSERPRRAARAGVRDELQRQRPERRRRLGRRRGDDRGDGRACAAGHHQHRHARHRRGLRPPRDRRRRDRRAGAQRPRGRDDRRLEGRLPRLDRRRQRGRRDPLRLPRRAAGRLPAEPGAGSRRTSSRPTSRRSASWCCRRPRCWSAATRRSPTSCCPTGTASARRRRASSRSPPASTARASCSSRSVPLPDQFLDNVLASPQGAITGEKFERFETTFVGAGDTLSAALAALLGHRRRAARRGRRGARLPRPGARRGLPPRHGQRHPRPLLLGPARRRRGRGGEPATKPRPASRRRHRAARTRAMSTERPRRADADATPRCSSAPSASSPAASTRRCAPFAPSAARRASSPAREGAYLCRRRGPALHRLHRLVGADDPRPRPPGGARGGAARGRRRACRSARRPSARSSWPRRSSRYVPSIEQVRLVSSGTEAAMSALRLARGATGRNMIVKFEGCYHGHADALLVKAGSGLATFGHPTSAGVPRRRWSSTRWCSNTTTSPQLEAAFAAARRDDRLRDDRADRRQHELRARAACPS